MRATRTRSMTRTGRLASQEGHHGLRILPGSRARPALQQPPRQWGGAALTRQITRGRPRRELWGAAASFLAQSRIRDIERGSSRWRGVSTAI